MKWPFKNSERIVVAGSTIETKSVILSSLALIEVPAFVISMGSLRRNILPEYDTA